eukprot:7404_1
MALKRLNLEADTDNAISKSSLQKLRTQQKTDDINNDHLALQLLRVFGGIDRVLDDYLSVDCASNLNATQLNKLHELLSPKTDILQQQATMMPFVPSCVHNSITSNSSNKLDLEDSTEADAFCYTFYTSDTFLHSIVNRTTASKLINATYSRSSYLFLIVFVIWCVLVAFYGIGESIIPPIYGIIMNIVLIPPLLLITLSANRQAFKLVIKSFEFWFKAVYSLWMGVLICIYYANLPIHYPVLTFIEIFMLLCITFPLFITIISMFDAIHLGGYTKLILCFVVACIGTVFTIYFQFRVNVEEDMMVQVTSEHAFSLISMITSSMRVLTIFIWKQFYNTRRRRGPGKCVMIKYTPYMQWINDDAEMCKQITMGIL